jgi:hypothetical protein
VCSIDVERGWGYCPNCNHPLDDDDEDDEYSYSSSSYSWSSDDELDEDGFPNASSSQGNDVSRTTAVGCLDELYGDIDFGMWLRLGHLRHADGWHDCPGWRFDDAHTLARSHHARRRDRPCCDVVVPRLGVQPRLSPGVHQIP